MALEQNDIQSIERILSKASDDMAAAIARSFERLEERIDATEARVYSSFSDLEDKFEDIRQDVANEVSDLQADIRHIFHNK